MIKIIFRISIHVVKGQTRITARGCIDEGLHLTRERGLSRELKESK
jgi:hypothetical protein